MPVIVPNIKAKIKEKRKTTHIERERENKSNQITLYAVPKSVSEILREIFNVSIDIGTLLSENTNPNYFKSGGSRSRKEAYKY